MLLGLEESVLANLGLGTTEFVDELFATFGPKQPASSPAQLQNQSQIPQDLPPSSLPQPPLPFAPSSASPNGPYGLPIGVPQQGAPDGGNYNRKRSFHEGFQADQEREDAPYNRAFKTPRRGRGVGRGDWMGRDGRAPVGQYPPHAPGFPMMPPAFPPFDQNDPMGAMMAIQGMGFPQMPGMPPMPMPPGQQPDQMGAKSGERCPFYETQGICYLGSTCPYQHGPEAGGAARDDEYDPRTSNIVMDVHRRGDGYVRGSDRGRGRGRGDRGFGPRGRRSEFSAIGPNEDTTVTTIVVEQIPQDKFDEATVREFFSQYGEIVDLSLQPHKKLALITYDTHTSAKQAWSSPKVIFDNRFVKVYWYKPKPEQNGDRPNSGDGQGIPFNREEFEKQQEEAQKAYEEKRKRREETEQAKQALDKQREELLMKQQEEKGKLLQRLGVKGESNGAEPADAPESAADENANDQTKTLRAQLAALEAEAKSLGLDPTSADTGSPGYRGRGRGYGGHRGRGGFAPRGRGYDPSYRGGYRGRGTFRGRGGVLRLDNRPRRIAVSGVELNSEKDEALRQFLIVSSMSPSQDNTPTH